MRQKLGEFDGCLKDLRGYRLNIKENYLKTAS